MIHFEIPDSIDDFLQRFTFVKYVDTSVCFFTNDDESNFIKYSRVKI